MADTYYSQLTTGLNTSVFFFLLPHVITGVILILSVANKYHNQLTHIYTTG